MSDRINLEASQPNPVSPATVCPTPPGSAPSRRRCGKIARLPKEVREELNTRLDDGQSYDDIIQWLTSTGHDGFNKQNLSSWKQGGHQDWLREQERFENRAAIREWLGDQIEKSPPGEVLILLDQLYASQLLEALYGLDIATLKQSLAEDPGRYIALLNAYNRFKRQVMDVPAFQHFLRCDRKSRGRAEVMTPQAMRDLEIRLNLIPPGPPPPPPRHPFQIPAVMPSRLRQAQSNPVKPGQGQSSSVKDQNAAA